MDTQSVYQSNKARKGSCCTIDSHDSSLDMSEPHMQPLPKQKKLKKSPKPIRSLKS